MVFTRSGGAVDAYLWLRFRRDHDSGIDLYRAARQLGAPGRRAVGNGAGIRVIPGAVYGQLWGRHQGIWWNGLISTSIHFAHSTLRTSSFLQVIPQLNYYKLLGYLLLVF